MNLVMIGLDGRPRQKGLAAILSEVLDLAEGLQASFFEVTTAAAFLAFSRTPADACIIEVGLGGRLDATNIIRKPAVCGIASSVLLIARQWQEDDRRARKLARQQRKLELLAEESEKSFEEEAR